METNIIKSLKDLKMLARKSFIVLKSDNRKRHYNITLPVKSCTELHLFILDIVTLSLLAFDTEQDPVIAIINPCVAIRSVLEILLQLVPLKEAELLDKIHQLVFDEVKDSETKLYLLKTQKQNYGVICY